MRTNPNPSEGTVETLDGSLTHEEDDELRRLNWLSQYGSLSEIKLERLIELRLRDRRAAVGPPGEIPDESEMD